MVRKLAGLSLVALLVVVALFYAGIVGGTVAHAAGSGADTGSSNGCGSTGGTCRARTFAGPYAAVGGLDAGTITSGPILTTGDIVCGGTGAGGTGGLIHIDNFANAAGQFRIVGASQVQLTSYGGGGRYLTLGSGDRTDLVWLKDGRVGIGTSVTGTDSLLKVAGVVESTSTSGNTAFKVADGARLSDGTRYIAPSNADNGWRVLGHFIASAGGTYDFGVSGARWRTLYTNAVDASGNLTFGGGTITGTSTVGNTLTSSISAANATSSSAAWNLNTSGALDANDLLVDVKHNGTSVAKVDAEGDGAFAGSLAVTSTVTGGSMLMTLRTLSTCSSVLQGLIQHDSTGGSGAVYTKVCVCRYDGTTAKWWNVFNPTATTGTTTTCPN